MRKASATESCATTRDDGGVPPAGAGGRCGPECSESCACPDHGAWCGPESANHAAWFGPEGASQGAWLGPVGSCGPGRWIAYGLGGM
ncbi:hypothetical protein ACIBFB_12915 [Nocardiopsis sp. NPDC050513]|uniref:hypothetical protein n=1 Tax=Nocardiopsis sp. NPDC050513 TaxID=3364338 RepID=UPI0037B03EF4